MDKQDIKDKLNKSRKNVTKARNSRRVVNTAKQMCSIQMSKEGVDFDKYLSVFYLERKFYSVSHTDYPKDSVILDKGAVVNNWFLKHFEGCKQYLIDNQHLYLNPYTVVMVKMPYDLVGMGLVRS